jgi:hypothetical protein
MSGNSTPGHLLPYSYLVHPFSVSSFSAPSLRYRRPFPPFIRRYRPFLILFFRVAVPPLGVPYGILDVSTCRRLILSYYYYDTLDRRSASCSRGASSLRQSLLSLIYHVLILCIAELFPFLEHLSLFS